MVQFKSPSSRRQHHRLLQTGVALVLVGGALQSSQPPLFQSTANAVTQENSDLKMLREDADKKIKAFEFLNTDYKNDFLELLRQYDTSQSEIDQLLKEADEANHLAQEAGTSQTQQPQLDRIDEKIENLRKKVDEGQRKVTEAQDNLKTTTPENTPDQETSSSATANEKNADATRTPDSKEEDSLSKAKDVLQNVKERAANQQERPKTIDLSPQSSHLFRSLSEDTAQGGNLEAAPLRDVNDAVSQIDQAISTRAMQDNTGQYLANKQSQLDAVKRQIQQRTDISDGEKSQLLSDAQAITQQLTQQNDTILSQLKDATDKKSAVESILAQVYNPQEAKKLSQQIDVSGKTDQQLADQIHKMTDQLKSTSSDDLLRGMLDATSNRQGLLESILRARFDPQKAEQLAQHIMQGHPSNDTILQRLKTQFKSNGTATSDDILNAILDNTDGNPEVIKAILGGRLNSDNASLIAQRINQNKDDAQNILKQIEGELSTQANRLMTLREQLKQIHQNAQTNINDILAPLREISNIISRGILDNHLKSSGQTNEKLRQLLNQQQGGLLNRSGGLFEHDFAPKPEIDPYKAINSQTSSRGFLDGLFDKDGNFNLPNTGEITKNTWLPVGIVVVIFGVGSLVKFLIRRKKNKRDD